ncbi:CoxG family protein [Bradyrhizobium sp. SYSU BS000235]|uniref:CoxG family protein n=1 Tax=Bradyrhizobium sp. SYSU BS000235 TaxID=3411332 RepID=UPI003C774AEF
MGMNMVGEIELAAPRQTIWVMLNDPEILKQCIPGCESLEKDTDGSLVAVATNKVGPIRAKFKGRVLLLDLDPPNSYRISGEGDGGIAGFAKGNALVKLEEVSADVTRLTYEVDAQIGGKLAQLGQRLVNSVAKKLADQFFERFGSEAAKS